MQSEHPGLVLVLRRKLQCRPGICSGSCAQMPLPSNVLKGLNAVTVCKKLSTAPEFATQSVVSDREQSAHSTLDSLSDLAEMKMN
ncbi:hypothetical protein BV898_13989 [Hypsibius exemplaris]|uniref:Uncharacterized protein n=1 Tax=Hypsibius exemplaris TaxID=2072580 RepID=A0A1W0W973_HYPEX|nr:hypothetical protein BV898_13989 [Hypsibius exemplaris]